MELLEWWWLEVKGVGEWWLEIWSLSVAHLYWQKSWDVLSRLLARKLVTIVGVALAFVGLAQEFFFRKTLSRFFCLT